MGKRKEGNAHHPLFDQPRWESVRNGKQSSVNKRLRCELMRTVRMGIEPHDELHKHVSGVVMPDRYFMHRLENYFVDDTDPLRRIGNFIIAAEHALIHPQATFLEKDAGELMIEGIALQLPFIREGIIGDGR